MVDRGIRGEAVSWNRGSAGKGIGSAATRESENLASAPSASCNRAKKGGFPGCRTNVGGGGGGLGNLLWPAKEG